MPYDQCLSEVCLTPLSVSLCFCLICIYVLLYYYIDVVYIIRISVKIGRSLLVVQGLRLGLIVRDESVSLLFDCLLLLVGDIIIARRRWMTERYDINH